MFNHIIVELKQYKALDWAKLLLVILVVLSLGLFAVNQFAQFRYSAELLTTPCDLCLELNKEVDLCPKLIDIDQNFNKLKIISPTSLAVDG